MSNVSAQLEVRCPIELFLPQEAKIEVLTQAIGSARGAAEKVPKAGMLIDEVNVLLDCSHYDHADRNCNLCRRFAELRFMTANLIVKMVATGGIR